MPIDKILEPRPIHFRFIGHIYVEKLISIRIIQYCIIDLLKSVTERTDNSADQIVSCAKLDSDSSAQQYTTNRSFFCLVIENL